MRKMLLTTIVIFVLAMAVCTATATRIQRVTEHMRHLRSEAVLHMDAGKIQQVEETLSEMANYYNENETWLEIVCNHNDLHEIKGEIIDAQASIEFGIEDDFYQAISRFGECLEHIASIEKLSLANLC